MFHPQPSVSSRDWHSRECWGCGVDSRTGLRADFKFDETSGEVRFRYKPEDVHRGAPEFAHGGVLAAILDEAQGALCFHLGHAVMTEQLHLNYHRATPLNQEFEVRCWATAVRRRRMYTRGEIRGVPALSTSGERTEASNDSKSQGGELLVSGRGSWYLLPDRMIRRMFQGSPEHEAEYRRMLAILEVNRTRSRKFRHARREAAKS